MLILFIYQIFGKDFENIQTYISLKNTKLVLASFQDKEVRLVNKDRISNNNEYYDKFVITSQGKFHTIRIGDKYLNSKSNQDNVFLVDKAPHFRHKMKIIETEKCKFISSEYDRCLTKRGIKQKVKEEAKVEANIGKKPMTPMLEDVFYEISMEECSNSEDQCFEIEPVDKESKKSKDTRELADVAENYKKDKDRDYEKLKDYDMRYVHNDLDDAHHFLAENDFESILTHKRFVPECFYGYNSMSVFLNDPLPNLRKLKQKYCIHNRKHTVSNAN